MIRTAWVNKIQIWFCNEKGLKPIYKTDSQGNQIYTGKKEIVYTKPRKARVSFTQSGSIQANAEEYGLTTADFNAVMFSDANAPSLKVGSLVWIENKVVLNSDDSVNPSSADYIVKRRIINLDHTNKYLLKKQNN